MITSREVHSARHATRRAGCCCSLPIGSLRMAGGDVLIPGTTLLLTPATTFFSRNAHELTAVLDGGADARVRGARGSLGRAPRRCAASYARRSTLACASCGASSTLVIVLLGGLFALSQFGGLNRLATGVLASSAIVAAIVGFAARQTLANLVAGVMLTIAQPLRIGDQVTVEDDIGRGRRRTAELHGVPDRRGQACLHPQRTARVRSSAQRHDHRCPRAPRGLPLAPARGRCRRGRSSSPARSTPELVAQAAEVTPDGVRITVTARAGRTRRSGLRGRPSCDSRGSRRCGPRACRAVAAVLRVVAAVGRPRPVKRTADRQSENPCGYTLRPPFGPAPAPLRAPRPAHQRLHEQT